MTVPILRLLPTDASSGGGHGDEVLSCAYAPDSRFVLSGGWDGHLRLWDANSGINAHEIPASNKPVSACAVSPDGQQLISGTLDGMLARWNVATFQQQEIFLAHTRPVSAITFGSSKSILVTASWDRNLILWNTALGHEGRTMSGHGDIVAGCCITPDGRLLLSWSHDNTVRLWELSPIRAVATFNGHNDRVLSGAVSPDCRWGATGSRDQELKLWDLIAQRNVQTQRLGAEVRCCFFLLDGQHLVTAEADGRLAIFSLPDLSQVAEEQTRLKIECGALAPSGAQIALGCGDGRIHLVAVDGFDQSPLHVTVTQATKLKSSTIQKLFGRSSEVPTFVGACPACRSNFEVSAQKPVEQLPCPSCKRKLRISCVIPMGSAK